MRTSVDVNDRSHELPNHGATLNVPPRAAWAPRRLPGRLPRLCGLPECEIFRALLAAVHGNSLTSPASVRREAFIVPSSKQCSPAYLERERERVHAETVLMMRQHSEGSISAHSAPVVLLLSPRKAPVVGQRRHIKEHIPFNSIGMAVADDRLDHGDDVVDVLRGLCRSRPVYASETYTHTHTHTQVAIPTVPCVGRSKGTNRSSPEWGMPSTEQHSSMLHMLECFANLNCCHHQVCLLLQDGLRGKEGSRWLQGAQGGPWAPWWGSGIRGAPCLRETHG